MLFWIAAAIAVTLVIVKNLATGARPDFIDSADWRHLGRLNTASATRRP